MILVSFFVLLIDFRLTIKLQSLHLQMSLRTPCSSIQFHIVWSRTSIFKLKCSLDRGCSETPQSGLSFIIPIYSWQFFLLGIGIQFVMPEQQNILVKNQRLGNWGQLLYPVLRAKNKQLSKVFFSTSLDCMAIRDKDCV